MAMPALQNPYFPLSSNSALSNKPMNGVFDSGMNGTARFPHTRAQLSAIALQYRPTENYDSDAENEDYIKVPQVLLNEVVSLLVDEKEDELKAMLKSNFGVDEETAEQNVLDLMHKHRDDVAGVPFLYLTPTRRPISRPSSRASSHSTRLHAARPDTPTSAPSSPLVHVFRRPHTPVTSPLAPLGSSTAKSDYSPSSSPVLSHATVTTQAQWTASLPASPISSPRLLSAKASEFRPIPRPLSAAATHSAGFLLRADTPSPSPDLWAHNSPRATSNLAIAAPLIAESSPSSRPGTPSSVIGVGGSLRSNRGLKDDLDEEDDPFDPFASNPLSTFHSITISDFDTFDSHPWPATGDPNAYPGHYPASYGPGYAVSDMNGQVVPGADGVAVNPEDAAAMLTDGMTPFDVLSSVFGSTLAPSELEEALAVNSYDFDHAMAWLIDRTLPPGGMPSPPAAAVQGGPGGRIQNMGGRVNVVSREAMGSLRGGAPINENGTGIRGGFGAQAQAAQRAPRYVNGRPVPSGNRVCRYFVAGECLRADCRFSHDLERALCRFWLRGTCAKQESCEFLHHLPKDVDVNALHAMLARNNVPPGTGPLGSHTLTANNNNGAPIDEFPALGYDATQAGRTRKFTLYNDPSRTRFATAVKKPVTAQEGGSPNGNGNGNGELGPINVAARREIMGAAADSLHHQSAIVAPRPSPRIKLHPPTLLPTLPTGESLNNVYMAYRARGLQLGAARNACLSRAAEAWRRGDGAAAKRFSREGHELNSKMASEMADAAGKLVRERTRVAEGAVRGRDGSWSDDPGDRGVRGKVVGGGLGVCLGIGSKSNSGGGGGGSEKSPEERMEVILDLHGLHSNEATEVLEQFLLSLEREHFYGVAYAIVGEEKHTGTQDVARGASRARLAAGVREWLHRWGYPWSERDGIICIDPLTHVSE